MTVVCWRALPIVLLLAFCQLARAEEPKVHEVPKEGLVIQGKLNKDDPPIVAGLKGEPHQVHRVQVKKGVTYLVDVTSNAFDPYLIVMDAKGKTVAEDDDSGGDLNARVQLVAEQSGMYHIVVIAPDKKIGTFVLSVREGADWLASAKMAEKNEDFATAQKAYSKVLLVLANDFGAEHWKVTDVRLALRHVNILQSMSVKDRHELKAARLCLKTGTGPLGPIECSTFQTEARGPVPVLRQSLVNFRAIRSRVTSKAKTRRLCPMPRELSRSVRGCLGKNIPTRQILCVALESL